MFGVHPLLMARSFLGRFAAAVEIDGRLINLKSGNPDHIHLIS